jgi:hypothetical protein
MEICDRPSAGPPDEVLHGVDAMIEVPPKKSNDRKPEWVKERALDRNGAAAYRILQGPELRGPWPHIDKCRTAVI